VPNVNHPCLPLHKREINGESLKSRRATNKNSDDEPAPPSAAEPDKARAFSHPSTSESGSASINTPVIVGTKIRRKFGPGDFAGTEGQFFLNGVVTDIFKTKDLCLYYCTFGDKDHGMYKLTRETSLNKIEKWNMCYLLYDGSASSRTPPPEAPSAHPSASEPGSSSGNTPIIEGTKIRKEFGPGDFAGTKGRFFLDGVVTRTSNSVYTLVYLELKVMKCTRKYAYLMRICVKSKSGICVTVKTTIPQEHRHQNHHCHLANQA
jgi:hypothetical protein